MRVFLDERCLAAHDLSALLLSWREIADFVSASTRGLSLFLDRAAVKSGQFLQRLNNLRPGHRALFVPMLFGGSAVSDWRPVAIGGEAIYQVATESEPVTDCAICEVYEHRKNGPTIALLGHEHSSFVGHQSVGVRKVEPSEVMLEVLCGTELADLRRIGVAWDCLLTHYEANLTRPPRDDETILGRFPERFERVGRFERNGRRQVYREKATDRFLYVDNLHYGGAAHLEVFDSDEQHLGTADLDGNLDESTRVPGRVISW
jgi:hypothetical protein